MFFIHNTSWNISKSMKSGFRKDDGLFLSSFRMSTSCQPSLYSTATLFLEIKNCLHDVCGCGTLGLPRIIPTFIHNGLSHLKNVVNIVVLLGLLLTLPIFQNEITI